MKKSDEDLLKNELKKLFPDMKAFKEIVEQVEVKKVDNKSNYEVKEVNNQELENIRRTGLGKGGVFEKSTSNESKEYVETLNEVNGRLITLDEKLNKVIQYLEAMGK